MTGTINPLAAPEEESDWIDRFMDALTVLCGMQRPPLEIVQRYLDTHLDNFELQDWCASKMILPWSMGITIIDAAHILANDPEEGRNHKDNQPVFE